MSTPERFKARNSPKVMVVFPLAELGAEMIMPCVTMPLLGVHG